MAQIIVERYTRCDEGALCWAILSEGQAASIMQGKARLSWKRFIDFPLEWENSPYAVVQTEQEYGDWVVLDRTGREILRSGGLVKRNGNVFLTNDYMPRSAYEKIGFVDSDGRYDPCFHTCALIDADRNTTLMQGEYLYGQIEQNENMPRVYSFNSPLDISVFNEGMLEPLITLECDSGNVPLSHTGALNPTTNFTVSRDAVVYVGYDDDMVLHIPDNCIKVGVQSQPFRRDSYS